MLTLIEAISLAGDRAKQNDDAHGADAMAAWVIDGATDLHQAPITNYASDAAWLATYLNESLANSMKGFDLRGATTEDLVRYLRFASEGLLKEWECHSSADIERWMLPTGSVLIVSDTEENVLHGAALGDSRCFALDATGVAHTLGGADDDAATEAAAAAEANKRAKGQALLRNQQTVLLLRSKRARHNTPDGYWVFGLQPSCADHARTWSVELPRPAHILLCTDGLSALVDRYHAYDAAGLVRAALDKGLQELGRELRAIEAADAGGAKHPRFKPSDDATGVLLRLT